MARINQSIFAGIIVHDGIVTKFFMDDVSSQRTCVAIDKYKNGYYVSSNISFDTAYVSAALTMKEGYPSKRSVSFDEVLNA